MLRRALRYVLATSLTLVLWTLARPAMAAPAPFCDDRGASGIAAAPALEASDVAVQRARVTLACPVQDAFFGATLTRGRASPAPTVFAADPVLPVAPPALVPAPSATLDPPPTVDAPRDGERSRIERPPRG